jgi:glycosyltransferase involved in cell wall biosynthesis
MRTAALIPAYNEENNILEVIRKLKRLRTFYKIIVIDDGSKDRTREIAKKTRVIVISHKKNKGKGEAIKTGLKYIKKMRKVDGVVIIDADMQYEPKESLKIIEKLKEADFVMGYRNFSKIAFRHRLGNFVWKTTFNILFGTSLKDTNCGLVGLSKKCFDKLKVHGGYIIENSMLASAVKGNIKIYQVPVKVKYKNISTVRRGIKMVLGVLIFIIKEGLDYRLHY